MSDLPEPFTPIECDLHDYPWMPLDVTRLRASETWVLGNAEEKLAALSLWMSAWHQIPAGSLPDNDRMLAHLSDAGTAWKKVRAHAMRGWVKCSDGRLYHPVVCEKALESWKMKQAQRSRTEAARQAKAARKANTTDAPQISTQTLLTDTVTKPVTISVTETVTGSTGQDRTIRKKEKEQPPVSLPREPTAEPLAAGRLEVEGAALWQKVTGDSSRASAIFLKNIAEDLPPNLHSRAMDVLRQAQNVHFDNPKKQFYRWFCEQIYPEPPPEPYDPKRVGPAPNPFKSFADGEEIDLKTGKRQPTVNGYQLDVVFDLVCDAGRLNPATFRGDMRPLVQWLKDDFRSDQILAAVTAVASSPSYAGCSTLKYFDKAVRERRA
jgi:hypothetical protein